MEPLRTPSEPNRSDYSAVQTDSTAKAVWHPPTMEEIDYSATEAAGVGAVYDLTVYTGSV